MDYYSNDKIQQLIKERDRKISEMNAEIQQEIEKERAQHKFSWTRFLLLISIIALPIIMYEINIRIFPPTSIWSWQYYIKK